MTDTHIGHIHEDNSGSMGFMLGMILLIAFIFFLFFYGLPALRNSGSFQQAPAVQQQPDIKIPDKIDINVNK